MSLIGHLLLRRQPQRHWVRWGLGLCLSAGVSVWALADNDSPYATEKEQRYLDEGFILFPARKPHAQDPKVQAERLQAEEAQKRWDAQQYERRIQEAVRDRDQALQASRLLQAELSRVRAEHARLIEQADARWRSERERRQAAERRQLQVALEKSKTESDLKAQMQAQREVLNTQLRQREQAQNDSEARLDARLLAEEQARLAAQAEARQLKAELTRVNDELNKLRAERKNRVMISPAPQ
jgi:hypothetical protein